MILTVTVPSPEVFNSYYYGTADEMYMTASDGPKGPSYTYTLVYSDDFLAKYQEGRFASGLYFTTLLEGALAPDGWTDDDINEALEG